MKNKNKNNNNKNFTKKWFYIAVAIGVVFAIITTLIAIFRSVDDTIDTSEFVDSDFLQTAEKKSDIKKEPDMNMDSEGQTKKNKDKDDDKDDKEASASVENPPKKENQSLEFLKPVEGKILQKHSNDELVEWKVLGSFKTHDGIDIESKKNTPVKAVADGTISDITNEEDTWGICITIDHKNGLQSIYKGLSDQLQVKLDQKVKAGDVIGTLGSKIEVENNFNDHLHFMMKKDDQWVDPLKYIKF